MEIFDDINWKKERTDMPSLSMSAKKLQRAHEQLEKLDLEEVIRKLNEYSSYNICNYREGDLTSLDKSITIVESVVQDYLAKEERVNKGAYPVAGEKVAQALGGIEHYNPFIADLLDNVYEAFAHGSEQLETLCETENHAKIRQARATLDSVVGLYQELFPIAVTRGLRTKRKLDSRIRKYIAHSKKIDALESKLSNADKEFREREWGKNNLRVLRKLHNQFFRRWLNPGLAAECEKANYPEGKYLAEQICSSMEHILNFPEDTGTIRQNLKDDISSLKLNLQEVQQTTASQQGIRRLYEISASLPEKRHSFLDDNFYFRPFVQAYTSRLEKLTAACSRKLQSINLECEHQYERLAQDPNDIELERLQRMFVELKNFEYSDKVTNLRRKLNKDSGFFSMLTYLRDHNPPPLYVGLNEILMGGSAQNWIERLEVFTELLGKAPPAGSNEKKWLGQVRYAIQEDSVRGYLNRVANFGYRKEVINQALATIDRKAA